MPIQVTVAVNGNDVTHLQIARVTGGMDRIPGKNHGYVVLEQPRTPQNDWEWDEGLPFEHAYGEGLLVCVQKALEAVNQAAQK